MDDWFTASLLASVANFLKSNLVPELNLLKMSDESILRNKSMKTLFISLESHAFVCQLNASEGTFRHYESLVSVLSADRKTIELLFIPKSTQFSYNLV